jgi:nicotinate phosphoribosyltransferase
MIDIGRSLLLTDLYQLTMLQAYWQHRMHSVAVFELFVRTLPAERRFMIFAGLESVLDHLQHARFDEQELAWIDSCGRFAPGFSEWLRKLRFTGDVWAMPEGTVFFPGEPVLRVVAPIAEAQLFETRILNLIHLQTLLATKAAHCVLAAGGRDLIDFGLRRAHGAEAGLLAARSAWIGGFAGSATALAGQRFGIPVFGTMAHSFVQAHGDEAAAFTAFAESFPDNAVLLIDTYDTLAAARTVAELSPVLAARGIRIKGVRLDSGDLDALSRAVRGILDGAGLKDALILASGNLDEFKVRELVRANAPISSFGIGTSLTTSSDAPSLDAVYKLQEYDGVATRKRSAGKATWPGRKQVWRTSDEESGAFVRDLVGRSMEQCDGTPLLQPVMHGGKIQGNPPALAAARDRCRDQLARLPRRLHSIDPSGGVHRFDFPVYLSAKVRELADEADCRVTAALAASRRGAAS